MTPETFLDGRISLFCGDSREVLKKLPDNHFDSLVCDPPYALVSISKRFGSANAAAVKVPEGGSGAYARASRGFMGKQWDTGETAFATEFWAECLRVLKPGGHVVAFSGTRTYHRMACAIEDAGFEIRDQIQWIYATGFPKSRASLKPAHEPIAVARKPMIGTIDVNEEKYGTGAFNIDRCRIGEPEARTDGREGEQSAARRYTDKGATNFAAMPGPRGGSPAGRWPANIITDGSGAVIAAFPKSAGQQGDLKPTGRARPTKHAFGDMAPPLAHEARGDSGSAARFFYTAKADASDRIGSKHPTVKPVDLMQWLCRLVTPKNGTILDPFAGTGTTGEAAFREGFNAILIEREEEYQADIRRRMALCMSGPDERARESIKARTAGQVIDAGPLFAGSDTPPAGADKSTESSRTNNRADGIEMVKA